MKDLLAPSIMCGNLLNLEREIAIYEEGKADLIHFDIMDTTFTKTTMLPPSLIPAIQKATRIPVDVHVMVDRPERFIDTLLPLCKDAYVSFHVEVTKEIQNLLKAVKTAGGHPSVALNPGTPLCMIEEVAPLLDMLLLLTCNAGHGPKQDIDAQMADKIRRGRALLDRAGRTDAMLEVDGNISFQNAKTAQRCGANVYVLGTASIYRPDSGVVENMEKLRAHLATPH
ncbi:ribulose-phosphate 3-epimerase [Zongyangia hominis]|uniref:Ribulose-phosphate 3-epimerase n=1 Tax=Zongyangia hominis TaxID=2763677 RepID=A0A926IAZ5_9FIRM|nr:ribulose-phosphate 3-epimerase [Zongyangia hominis]MBC8570706.1 ribulose-phosphate 3-epimerase [Zongyangia hominis]